MHPVRCRLFCGAVVAASLAFLDFSCDAQPCPKRSSRLVKPSDRSARTAIPAPANQVLTPAGLQVELPKMRPQAIALSPNGKLLVTAGKTPELVVIDPASGTILQRVGLPSGKNTEVSPESVPAEILRPDKEGQLSFTGLVFSPDGTRVYLADVRGAIKVFGVRGDGKVVGLFPIPLPAASPAGRGSEIVAGMAVSPDGKRLYAGAERIRPAGRAGGQQWKDRPAVERWSQPFDVALAGRKVYVSNWGGRRPEAQSLTGPAGREALVRVDPVRHIASEGSVSVIELDKKNERSEVRGAESELLTGLHACAIAASPNGRWVVVANAGSDSLSVIDSHTDRIVETICARQNPADLWGATQRPRLRQSWQPVVRVQRHTERGGGVRFQAR